MERNKRESSIRAAKKIDWGYSKYTRGERYTMRKLIKQGLEPTKEAMESGDSEADTIEQMAGGAESKESSDSETSNDTEESLGDEDTDSEAGDDDESFGGAEVEQLSGEKGMDNSSEKQVNQPSGLSGEAVSNPTTRIYMNNELPLTDVEEGEQVAYMDIDLSEDDPLAEVSHQVYPNKAAQKVNPRIYLNDMPLDVLEEEEEIAYMEIDLD